MTIVMTTIKPGSPGPHHAKKVNGITLYQMGGHEIKFGAAMRWILRWVFGGKK